MADDESQDDAFGYRPADLLGEAIGVQVAEGKHGETLAPAVVIFFRFDPDGEQVGVAVPLTLADGLADEIRRWAQRAREKHWE